jgi:hypothetical protein
MANMTNFLEEALGNHVLRGIPYTPPENMWCGLYEVSPGEEGTGTEVEGGDYERIMVEFDEPTDSAWPALSGVHFTNLPPVDVAAIALHDESEDGNVLYYFNLPEPISVQGGDGLTIPAGTLIVTKD